METVGTGQSEVEVARVADTVLLVLMPGSGDSIQALKAGIMEIPDVIAVNKLDHPAAKTMVARRALDPRSRPGARLEAADRPHGGAARGGRGGAVGQRSASTARTSRQTDCSTSGGASISPPRCSPSSSARAKTHLERAVRDDPELARVLEAVQRA